MSAIIDATGPTDWNRDKEARALRRKVSGWANRRVRDHRSQDAMLAGYARALGIPVDVAESVCARHRQVNNFVLVGRKPLVDATGPTDWNRDKEARALRRKVSGWINRRCAK